MKYSSTHYAQALYNSVKKAKTQKDLDRFLNSFISLLVSRNDIYKWRSIIKQYRAVLLKKGELDEVYIVTAVDISDEIRKKVLKVLNISKDVKIVKDIDENMIGGIFIKYNSTLFDLSVARRLSRLNNKLIKNIS